MSEIDFAARISITPEPTDEEASVIVAALAALSGKQQVAGAPEAIAKQPGSQWALVGRRSAHSSSPHARTHWSRDLAWLEQNER
ncbi:MAG: hypothetical protein ACRDHN_14815 [Thermomicrobiales bacterium]